MIKNYAQVAINTTNADPDPSAILDISSTEKGILIPRMTTAQRTAISNTATGLLVYDKETNSFWFFDGTNWVELVTGQPSTLADTDQDTRIQVEKSADEDLIRFDIGGEERFRMNGVTLETENYSRSVFMGEGVGLNVDNTSRTYNIGIGYQALEDVMDGFGNIGIGRSALSNLSNGNYNTGVGYSALSNASGSNNTALGYFSLTSNQDGTSNAALGYFSMRYFQSGNYNVAIGTESLNKITSGSNNVAIGYQAGGDIPDGLVESTGNVFLGYQAGKNSTGNNKLYIDNSDTETPLIYGDFENDTLQVNGVLNINDTYSLPKVDGTNGQVLTTNGTGESTWTTINGADNLGNHTASQNLQTNGHWLSNDGDSEGLFITNIGTVAIGTDSPVSNTSLHLTLSGANTPSLRFAQTDESFDAYSWDFAGNEENFFLRDVGNGQTLPFRVYAGQSNNRLSIRNNSVGIGTNNPSAAHLLDVSGSARMTGLLTVDDSAIINGVLTVQENTNSGNVEEGYVAVFENTNGGAYSNGIFIKAGETSRTVNNRFIAFVRPDNSQIASIRQSGSSQVSYNTGSDIRLKNNITLSSYGLTELMKIQVADYTFKEEPTVEQHGFLAQQLQDHYPFAVTEGGADEKQDPWMVDYGRITPLLVQSIQEQQKILEQQAKEIAALQQELAARNQ